PMIGLLFIFKKWLLEFLTNTVMFSLATAFFPLAQWNTIHPTRLSTLLPFLHLPFITSSIKITRIETPKPGLLFSGSPFSNLKHLLKLMPFFFCVFKSNDHTHQTLKGVSHSEKYTRIGFSCQMSEKMSNAVVA
ncbi:uncharacterized protein VP01_14160g1, partial [Puccinia sorghi]